MKTYTLTVETPVKITIDESKFTEEFLNDFKGCFYLFDTIEEHVEYLARLVAIGAINFSSDDVEGYGVLDDMGIKFKSERATAWIDRID